MTVTLVNAGAALYSVDSERGEKSYLVDLKNRSCTCPDWKHRRSELTLQNPERLCKHARQAEHAAPFLKAEAKAKGLSDAALLQYLEKYGNDPVVGGALRVERARRQVTEAQQADLKALFS